jgi:acyl-CoA thioester hydrolase
MRVKIYYHHTDSGGVVYYANYLQFFEEARSEFLEVKGVSLTELVKKGWFFVVSRQEIDYKAPAYYGDILDISSLVTDLTRVRINFAHEVKNESGNLICIAKTTLVYVNRDFKPTVIPQEIIAKLGIPKKE